MCNYDGGNTEREGGGGKKDGDPEHPSDINTEVGIQSKMCIDRLWMGPRGHAINELHRSWPRASISLHVTGLGQPHI